MDGHAVIQDEEGWWCYAFYENDGSRINSGWRLGQNVPSEVLTRSQNIPREIIAFNAAEQRKIANYSSAPQIATRALFQNRAIVILAQFQDIKFVNSREDFLNLLMSDDYTSNGATGSVREYFNHQFNGMVDFVFDVSEIVTLPAARKYYGENNSKGNDIKPEEMIIDACSLAAENGINFSHYDSNNDGKVDNVFVFFAGEDEAEGADENSIWSHSWYLFTGAGQTLELNGKMIDRYACSSEMTRIQDISTGKLLETRLCGIGTFCHEYGHTFGLPDMYDTDYEGSNGWSAGLWGSTSLMDTGNQNNQGNTPPNFNAIERELLGLSSPVLIETDGKFTLSPINSHGEFYRINTKTENEYYLLECRSNAAGTWDEFIGGSGMLVYHIDKTASVLKKWEVHNSVNCVPSHQCADLVEADGRNDVFADIMDYRARKKNIEGIFFPYHNTNSIPSQGTPGLNFWKDTNQDISIINIEKDVTGKVHFNVIGYSEESTPPSVKGEIAYEVFSDGVILNFESDRPYGAEAYISYKVAGQEESTEITAVPYQVGKYAVLIEDLEAVRTYTVSIHFVHNEIKGNTTSVSFMTKKKPSVSWPYIPFVALKTKGFMEDDQGMIEAGSRLPLKVINTEGVKDILWFFNRKPITHEGDHYFTLNENGTLEAHLYMEDGQEYILIKEIRIKQ